MNLSISLDGIFLVAMETNIGDKYKLVHSVHAGFLSTFDGLLGWAGMYASTWHVTNWSGMNGQSY